MDVPLDSVRRRRILHGPQGSTPWPRVRGRKLRWQCPGPTVMPRLLAHVIGKRVQPSNFLVSAQCAAPGEVIVPWNEPEVKPVAKLIKRSTVKLPAAPANRPVPPVMV